MALLVSTHLIFRLCPRLAGILNSDMAIATVCPVEIRNLRLHGGGQCAVFSG